MNNNSHMAAANEDPALAVPPAAPPPHPSSSSPSLTWTNDDEGQQQQQQQQQQQAPTRPPAHQSQVVAEIPQQYLDPVAYPSPPAVAAPSPAHIRLPTATAPPTPNNNNNNNNTTDPTALMLETAANAAAAHPPTSHPTSITDDAIALAAMQEAATLVMEAAEQRQHQFQEHQQHQNQHQDLHSPLEQQQDPNHRNPSSAASSSTSPLIAHPPYTYAAANAAYSPSIISGRSNNNNNNTVAAASSVNPTPATTATSPSNHNRNTTTGSKRKRPNSSEEGGEQHHQQQQQQPSKKRSTPARVPWEERLRQLQEYKEQHGDLLIPIRYKPSNLGKFVHNTREQYKLFHKQTPEGYKKKCSLTQARIQQLEELGFYWTTERSKRQNDDWQRRLEQLETFKQQHGHCLVPHGYAEDPSFAEWIHRQRTSYNAFLGGKEMEEDENYNYNEKKTTTTTTEENGSPNAVAPVAVTGAASSPKAAAAAVAANPMMQARFQRLKDMGFNFTVHSDKWMDHWNQLKVYKEKHGDCQVPTHFAENQKLGRWVHTQRHQRRLQAKGKKSCMTPERIALLDQLGFSWEVRPSLERPRATWHQRLDELQAFYQNHGHFQVDAAAMPQLHAWCHEQKNRLKLLERNQGKDLSKRMNPERVKALEGIGFTKDTELLDQVMGTNPVAAAGTTTIPTTTTFQDQSSPSLPATNNTGDTNDLGTTNYTMAETDSIPMDTGVDTSINATTAATAPKENVMEDQTYIHAPAVAVNDGVAVSNTPTRTAVPTANPPPVEQAQEWTEHEAPSPSQHDTFPAPAENGQDSFQNIVSI